MKYFSKHINSFYNNQNTFSINRSYKFLNWRLDNHPNNKFEYLLFNILDNKENNYLIINKEINHVSIIDFSIFDKDLFEEIYEYLFKIYKVAKIKIMTSDKEILKFTKRRYGTTVKSFNNFYKLPDEEKNEKIRFHETYLTSDIYDFN